MTTEATATKSQVSRWNSPSASVLASSPATVVGGWSPVSVSMWCHCRIWCRTPAWISDTTPVQGPAAEDLEHADNEEADVPRQRPAEVVAHVVHP